MAVIDTSFLIALNDINDRFHEEAAGAPLFQEAAFLPAEIWMEYCLVLTVRPRHQASVLENTLRGPFVVRPVLEPSELASLAASVPAFGHKMKRLGFKPLTLFDLVVCTVAQRLRESIRTFDEGMKAAVRARMFPGARLG
ncbi:MAG TPA: PIN domain-containing protein [Candidatus Thermoplasmatota archaeon]|nr:PIN domain-containing protein [Candidatus Thermoplasmatota archaeon]